MYKETYRHENRLVVASRSHGANPVDASRQPTSDGGTQTTISITSIIDTLEEGEGIGVRWRGRVQTPDILDRNMGMTDNLTLAVKSLGSRVIGGLSIGEGACLEAVNLQANVEVLVCWEVLARLGEQDHRRNHVISGRNISHNCSPYYQSCFFVDKPGSDIPIPLQDPPLIC